MLATILEALRETILMVFVSGCISSFFGLLLGMLLFTYKDNKLVSSGALYWILNFITKVWLALPHIVFFIITIVALTKIDMFNDRSLLTGIIAISCIATPIMATRILNELASLPNYLADTAKDLGATTSQALFKIYLPEILPAIWHNVTITLVNTIQYSTLAGVFGSGGLGYLLMQKCYHQFSINYLIACCMLLVAITYIIRSCGNKIASYIAAH